MDIIFLEPVFKNYIWGGQKLKQIFKKNTPYDITAESWEISTNKNGVNKIINGEYKDKYLNEIFEEKNLRTKIFGTKCAEMQDFPLLIKYIDAKQNLSVQVHPDDEYARKYENDYGKNELWYIMDCPKNAKLVCGLNERVTRENLNNIVRSEKIKENLRYIDIEKGDSIYIPSGTVHAILSDTLVCEIQQNSNLTYRIYDWDRVDKDGKRRELHISKAIDVINLDNKIEKVKLNNSSSQNLISSRYFSVDRIDVNGEKDFTSNMETFYTINVVEGSGKVFSNNKEYVINCGDSFIIPAQLGKFKIDGKMIILVSYM